ncbi:MAG: hypothetical protein IKT25_08750 [Firmicutes bacterium]|nr:hypothetical protein [Bacillota bacterium]
MTDRELRRLSRSDLLELLLAQRKENEQLRCMLDQAEARLADRTIKINNAGSIAEASLQLNGIFTAAQDSCQSYIDNIKLLNERQTSICQQMENETRERCDRMVAEAELKSQQCWDNCSAKIRELMSAYSGLQQAMEVLFNQGGSPFRIEGKNY